MISMPTPAFPAIPADASPRVFSRLRKWSRTTRSCSVRAALSCMVAFLLFAIPGLAQQQLLTRHVREAVRNGSAKLVRRLSASQSMRLVLTLPLRNRAELDSFVQAVSNPASSSYRHYLTVDKFTEEYGPSQQDYDAVVNFAKSSGLTVVSTSRNRLNVYVEGPVANIEKALHVTMSSYRHPTENREFYSLDREPTLDLAVKLWHISGLDNYSIPHPAMTKRPAAQSNASPADSFIPTGSGPSGYFLGSDMRAAYYGGTTLTGAGQSVGLFALNNGVNLDDLTAYFNGVGQTNNVTITQISTDGTQTDCSYNASTGVCDDTEQVLDITQAIGMAPGLSSVVMYVGSSDASVFNAMATASPLNAQLSCSWLWRPSDPSADDPYFEEFAAQGQTLFVAAGDDGAWFPWGTYFETVFPSEDPYVTSVGGTDLETSSAGGPWASETVWSDTGGGISPDEFVMPYWQAAAASGCADCSTAYRNGPDVAANANSSFYVCADQLGCLAGYGGTSFATPMWAGFMALVNQQSVANGGSTVGLVNPALYEIGNGTSYNADFHDITSGNNSCYGVTPDCNSPLWYSAATGYDLVSGLGSPNGSALINALAPPPTAPGFTFSVSTTSLSLAPGNNGAATVTTSAINGFTSAIILSASGQPAGVTVSFSPTPIAAPGSGTSTMAVSIASNTAAGTYPITVIGTGGGIIHTAAVSLTVSGPGFKISTSITTGAIAQGGNGFIFTPTITAVTFGGFDSAIALSASGMPTGVTPSFNISSFPAPGNGTSSMSFSVAPNAAPGTYPITVIGTGGGITNTTTFFLVIEGLDIYASSSPNILTVTQGSSATSIITVMPVNGFTGAVPLSASGLPDGVTASFNPNPLTGGGGNSVLTLTASDTAMIGTAAVLITAAAPYPPGVAPVILLSVVSPSAPNFTISAVPASVSVSQGNTASATITTAGINGFNAPISFSASGQYYANGQPIGINVSFNPTSTIAPGSGATTVTFSAGIIIPPGVYPITITGTGGGIAQSVTVMVTVLPQAPSFSIFPGATPISIAQGATGSTTIYLVIGGGFDSDVVLSASGQPSGVTVSFTPSSIPAPGSGSSVMAVAVAFNVVPGTYPITVTGTGGGIAYSTTVALEVIQLSNFGSVNVGTTSSPIPVFLAFGATGTLSSTSVLTQGATGLDFADAGTGSCMANTDYTGGQTCTVNVAFTPRFAGTRYGAVVLRDSSGMVLATGYLQGTGVGPQANFLPGTESALPISGPIIPLGMAVDGTGNLYLAEIQNNVILKETLLRGTYTTSIIPTSQLSDPHGVAVDGGGNIYIADSSNYRILKETPSASSYLESVVASFPSDGSVFPMALAVDGMGNFYISCSSGTLYMESLIAGSYVESTISTGTPSLAGVAVDGVGNVYVVDDVNIQILKETPFAGSYVQSTLPTTGLINPVGIAVDTRGIIYISDDGTNTVFIETPASDGYAQSALSTSPLNWPSGITVDGAGNIYVGDSGNSRVLKEDLADPPSLTFAGTVVGSTSPDSPQTVTVENAGNAALSFPAASAGNNPSITADFTLNNSGASACPLIGASSSTPGTLAAGASCLLPISFTPTVAGALNGSLVLTDNNLNAAAPGYAVQSITLGGTGTQATPTITWAAPAAITYGTPLSATQLNATASVSGTFTYSPAAGTVLTAGLQTLTATFTPTDSVDYTTATATVTLTVNQATPTITWFTPAAITYGTLLSATQLNASSPVAGGFTYSPAAGTVLTAGSHTLSVSFAPTDNTDYTTATATVTLTVNQATPTITWATPTAITYGTPLSATQLNASSPVAGGFTYSPAAGTVLNAGTQTLTVTFAPTDTIDYTTATARVTLIVNKAALTINWATPAAIPYGTALSGTQLDATSTASGSYVYSPAAGTVLAVGSHTLSVTFTPTNAGNYSPSTATASVTLTVNKAVPTITWATPAAITYGTALSATQLDASSTVAGSFTYSPVSGTVLTAGSHTLSVTFAPTNTTDYTSATATVTLTVNKATPTITWATPAAITYGTALSATQLNAKASVPGTFVYSPAAGTLPAIGTDTLTVTFTPTDTTDYTTATGSVQLKVNPAPSFTLGASPASLTVAQGASGKSTITVTDQNGFTGSVTLAATALPSGVTAAFASNPTTGTSVLTLTASSAAAVGSATITIKGTSGSLIASTTVALTIRCTPTTIVPFISINGGSTWTQESSATVNSPSTVVDLGPQPASGGTWSWTGPSGYTSTSRQINGIPLTVGADSYLATYTNPSGCKSTETFTITVK